MSEFYCITTAEVDTVREGTGGVKTLRSKSLKRTRFNNFIRLVASIPQILAYCRLYCSFFL